MIRTFIETPLFTTRWHEFGLTDDDLFNLQLEILADPCIGKMIEGTGGLRKVRVPYHNKGKRGGLRVCYVDCIIDETVYLITVYKKSEQTNLTQKEKTLIKSLVKELTKK